MEISNENKKEIFSKIKKLKKVMKKRQTYNKKTIRLNLKIIKSFFIIKINKFYYLIL